MINEREITMEQLPQVGFMKSFVLFWKIMLILRGDQDVVNIGI